MLHRYYLSLHFVHLRLFMLHLYYLNIVECRLNFFVDVSQPETWDDLKISSQENQACTKLSFVHLSLHSIVWWCDCCAMWWFLHLSFGANIDWKVMTFIRSTWEIFCARWDVISENIDEKIQNEAKNCMENKMIFHKNERKFMSHDLPLVLFRWFLDSRTNSTTMKSNINSVYFSSKLY